MAGGSQLTSSGVTAYAIPNCIFQPVHSGNTLVAAVKTPNGNDPSPIEPLYAAIPDPATGLLNIRIITYPVGLTTSSGSTFGAVNATPFRIWWELFDDAGTIRLAARNCSTSSAIFALPEFAVASSVAEGGAGAADSAGVFYSTVAVTSKPFRIFAHSNFDSGLATVGTWNVDPSSTIMFGPGSKKPGDIVQRNISSSSTATKGSTVIPFDGTVPQNTEGDQYFSTAITPTSPINLIESEYKIRCSNNSPTGLANAAALFKDSDASAIDVGWGYLFNVNVPITIDSKYVMRAVTTSQITFKIRAGGGGSTGPNGTDFILNGASSDSGVTLTAYYGGAMSSYHYVTEIMG